MTKTEYLEQICIKLGIDVSVLPDRLVATYLSAIAVHLGVDIATLENCTLSEWLQIIRDNAGNGGGGSYEQGFEDGKASVKIITFYAYTDWEEPFNALSTMTWREFVNSPFNTWDSFHIEDGKIRYGDYHYVDAELDDIIVELGVYQLIYAFSLSCNGNTYTLLCHQYQEWSSWVESDFNTMGLYFDENNDLRMPTGEFIYADTDMEAFKVNKWSSIEWSGYKAITLCSCDIGFETLTFESGMTWNDFSNSSYRVGTGVYVGWNEESYDDELHHSGGSESQYFYYNGNRVVPSDLMIDGATYEYR